MVHIRVEFYFTYLTKKKSIQQRQINILWNLYITTKIFNGLINSFFIFLSFMLADPTQKKNEM